MEIREIPISEIQPAPYNPRKDLKPGDFEYEKLRQSINHFGDVEPMVWNKRTTHLVGGHQRYKIFKERGDTTAKVVVVDLDEAEEKALNIALNKVHGDWDVPALENLLRDLRNENFDLGLTGFSTDELDDLLTPPTIGNIDEDSIPEPKAQPVSRHGDLWLMELHRLQCGDATKPQDVRRLLNGQVPDILGTDQPYGVNYDPAWRNRSLGEANRAIGVVQNDDRADWREAWALYEGPILYVWHAGTKCHIVAESLIASGFEIRSQIIWVKPHFAIGRGAYHVRHEPCFYAVRKGCSGNWQGDRSQNTVWEIGNGLSQGGPRKPEDAHTIHSTQKPTECMRRPLLNHTQVGESVYDPFCGSGTSVIAAETCRRVCFAMEIDPIYVDVAIRRWEAFTGKKAVLDADGRSFEEIAALRREGQ